jgi:hypothetical protein
VPPPPVAGAAVGNGLVDGLGVADGLRVGDRLAEGLTLALGVATLAVPLGGELTVAELVAPGENVVGVAGGEDAVQAETDAEASMAKVAQLAAVNLALSRVPMMVIRIFTGSPHASGRWRTRFRSRHLKRNRGSARSLSAPLKAGLRKRRRP